MARHRGRNLLLIALLLVGGGLAAVSFYKDELASRALLQVASVAEKAGHRVTFGGVHVSLRGGHIRISDLNIVPLADSTREDSAVRYTVHADAIELAGVDIWALLGRKVLHVGRIALNAPSVDHSFRTRSVRPAKDTTAHAKAQASNGLLELIRVDTLMITDAKGRSQDRAETNPAFVVQDLDLLLTGIRVRLDGQGDPMPAVDRIHLALHKVEAHLKPYYVLSLDSMRVSVPEDTALIHGLRFTPTVGPKNYHKHVSTQVELYQASVDTIMLIGFDLAAKLQHGALRARALHLAGASVGIHRDKSVPDIAKKKLKPLAADRVTAWKVPVSLDSIRVVRSSVTYHERVKRGDDYGSIAFTAITGLVTGLSNEPSEAPADLHLAGTAEVGKAHAQLDVVWPMGSEHTTVTAHVRLRNFPAMTMNRMTDDLLHLNATNGMVHLVDMHMVGDDDRATGTLDMQYEDLELQLNPEVKHAKIFSAIANTVVRGTNMPGTRGYRIGRFSVERQKDSGLFKYIWISLRTGMMEVVLPPVLLKQMKKQKAKK